MLGRIRIPLLTCFLVWLLFLGCGVSLVTPEPKEEVPLGVFESASPREVFERDGGVAELPLESGVEPLLDARAGEPSPREQEALRKQLPMRGVTLSAPRDGRIYSTSAMEKTMAELKQLGVNWITYHPYAWIRNDGTLIFREDLNQAGVLHPIQQGKKLGLGVMLKPHIGYWGSKFSWRGEIGFGEDEQAWKRFFGYYKRWIVSQAKMAEAAGAEIVSIGLEYKKTEQRKEWFEIIQAVRKVYSGKLTYSANWDSFDKVPFWKELDFVGIQAYFPLSDVVPPTEKELVKGWQSLLSRLRTFSEKAGKPILFTEIGYNRSAWAAQKPWDYTQGGPKAEETKLLCMKVALEQLKAPRFIEGVFLWKWFPDGRISSFDFILQYPEMKEVLRKAWSTL